MKENWREILSKRLINEFKRRKKENPNYTQKSFSDDLNISESMLTQMKNCERNITLNNAYNISKELDCSIDYLVRDNVPKNNIPNQNEINIKNFSNFFGINENSFLVLKKLSDDGYSKYIDELLFNYNEIDELMYLIKNYFEYEEYNDRNPNDELRLNEITIKKDELYLLKIRERLKKIKENSQIAKERYIRIIDEIKQEIAKINEYDSKLRDIVLSEYNLELDKYTNLYKECELVEERFEQFKALNEHVESECKKGEKNGKK